MIEYITKNNFSFTVSYPYDKFSEQDVINAMNELTNFFDTSIFDVRYHVTPLVFSKCYCVYVINVNIETDKNVKVKI